MQIGFYLLSNANYDSIIYQTNSRIKAAYIICERHVCKF